MITEKENTMKFEKGTKVAYTKPYYKDTVFFTVEEDGRLFDGKYTRLSPDWNYVELYVESAAKQKKAAWYEGEDFKEQLMNNLGMGKENAQTYAEVLQRLGKVSPEEAAAFSKVDTLQRGLRKGAEYWRNRGIGMIADEDGAYLGNDAEIAVYQDKKKRSAQAKLDNANKILKAKVSA